MPVRARPPRAQAVPGPGTSTSGRSRPPFARGHPRAALSDSRRGLASAGGLPPGLSWCPTPQRSAALAHSWNCVLSFSRSSRTAWRYFGCCSRQRATSAPSRAASTVAAGRQPICSMRRRAPSAMRAVWASGGSSELARVEADSSLSTTPQPAEVEAAGDEAQPTLHRTSASPAPSSCAALPPAAVPGSEAQSAKSRPSGNSETSMSAMLSTSSAPSKSRRAAPRAPFFAPRPFLSRPRAPGGGASAACSSCCSAAQAKSRHSEDPTCAWAKTRRR
mmetsp:Transcript_25610/g.74013  ORF Transcript_25610/g.74013 Transcript_25610/m.74013 type:complete len:276 (-) Transcript_25610:811-1638(-)